MSDTEALVTLTLAATTAVGLTLGRTYHLDHAYRHRWPRRQPAALASADAYRGASITPPLVPGQAPALVRNTALLSTWLGCMFVPGLLAGLVGLAAGGIGVISVPGLIISARCWRSGGLLLAADPRGAESARTTARWSAVLNTGIALLCLLALAYLGVERLRGSSGDDGLALPTLFTLAYAGVSLGHAWLLRRSAEVVEQALQQRGAQQGSEGEFLAAQSTPAAA
jgi:hypothetical protein